jgi:hypothetical protein
MVTSKHLHHSRDTDHLNIRDEVECQLIFDYSSDCCCTEDGTHDWGWKELMQPSLWGPPQQHARKGALEWSPGEVQLDDAGVKSTYMKQTTKERYAH